MERNKVTSLEPISVYLHIPFCTSRCAYCDFTTYAGKESLIPSYVDSLCDEIEILTNSVQEKIEVKTIFFGGGTPSLLTIDQFIKIMKTIDNCFSIQLNSEISLEANPGSVSRDYLIGLKNIGFNRISLGAQSTNNEELNLLGRIHNREDVFTSVKAARCAGFNNINLDLIYGLPGQEIETWKKSLLEIIGLEIEHISLYGLTIEKGTPFGNLAKKGLLIKPDPDIAAEMYEWSGKELERAGFDHYEISNWAKRGLECQHNLQYWQNQPYLGFGVGAHGYSRNMRVSNVLRIYDYINRIKKWYSDPTGRKDQKFPITPATISITHVNRKTSMQETLMLGLRLTKDGVSSQRFFNRYGVELINIFGQEISELLELKLIECIGETIRLTRRGHLLGNQVFMKFVD